MTTVIYRTLVVIQTIALAVVAVSKVVLRLPRAVLVPEAVGLTFTVLAIASVAAGVTAYRRSLARPGDFRRGVVVTWVCFHIAGLLAGIGYAITGEVACFAASVVALTAMHVLSPTRLTLNSESNS